MTDDTSITLLYSPFPDLPSARAAAQALLAERAVACCNLLPGIESHYWWEGVLTHANEVILLCKTTPEAANHAALRLVELHPYDVPAMLRLPATANTAFAQWVGTETTV